MPELTLSQAVEAFEVSRSTLRRRLDSNKLDGAHRDSSGQWRIPAAALHAAGFPARKTWLNASKADHVHERGHDLGQGGSLSVNVEEQGVVSELGQLRSDLAHERGQREAAEHLAEERLSHITSLKTALRAIEAAQTEPSKRHWWQRP